MKREVIRFLEAVWLSQPEGRYACVAWKEGELWRQRFIQRDDIERAYQNRGRDLYFCPNLFSKPDRANECAEPSRWLYADLDEVNPATIPDELRPTFWWETSPGRFQAMWEIDKALGRKAHDAVNQRLTYALNADLNGWPMNKVLRMPGSVSTKWGKPWRIEQGEVNGGLPLAKIWAEVRDTKVPAHSNARVTLSLGDKRKVKTLIPKLPKGCAALLRRRYVQDRSAHVYRLAKSMIEAGMKAEDIILVLSTSPVAKDKYGGRMEEELGRVVAKVAVNGAVEHANPAVRKKAKKKSMFKVQPMNRFLARTIKPPGWLIGSIWTDEAHGIIAGEEKTYKSMFVQDLAVSVATGTPFLNYFPVPEEKIGPVIYIQEENQESMVQDRFLKICNSRGLGRRGKLPAKMPLSVINNNSVDLTAKDHLQELIRLIKQQGAKMLILDPFYLMTPGVDENSAAEVIPVLKNLLAIKHELNCGVLIVHHYNKPDRQNPIRGGETARISGTGSFGRWYESMLLIERGEEDHTVKLFSKHRMSAGEPPVTVEFDMGDMGDLRYEPKVTEAKAEARKFYDELREAVESQPGVTIAALAKNFEMRSERMARHIRKSTHFRLEVTGNRSPMVYLR